LKVSSMLVSDSVMSGVIIDTATSLEAMHNIYLWCNYCLSNPFILQLELDGKLMTNMERWVMSRIVSQRTKQRAGYGAYVPAKSPPLSSFNAGQLSKATVVQHRPGPRVHVT
jgi:hypothetical protein